MIESLVITLREGIEAALVVGIILAYLRKVDRMPLARAVYAGLALAIVGSLVAGILFSTLRIEADNPYFEGTLFGIAGILAATMVVWMWRTARGMKGEMEAKLAGIVQTQQMAVVGTGGLGLMLFTFVMVFREGLETVLFLFAATLGEFNLLSLTVGALIDEGTLSRLKTIFWRNNIIGFAPYLSAPVTVGDDAQPVVLTGTWFEQEVRLPPGTAIVTGAGEQGKSNEESVFKTGVKAIAPWWRLRGAWVTAGDDAGSIVGVAVAERLKLSLGDRFTVKNGGRAADLKVAGIVTTGGYEDNQLFVNLPVAQRLAGLSRGVDRVQVSALTMPKEKLPADIRDKPVSEMTPKEYEKWYCSPIIDAVTKQIEEVIPGSEAKAVRQFSEQEAREALERVGLGHRIGHLPAQLSGGEQQRVCVARALINQPKIILADEPTGNLDEQNEERVIAILSDLHAEGHTIIMVTPDPSVGAAADRIVRLDHGRVVETTSSSVAAASCRTSEALDDGLPLPARRVASPRPAVVG